MGINTRAEHSHEAAPRGARLTIDDDLLAAVDADPEAQERGRSAFIRSALRLYLRAKERRAIDAQIREAYGAADEERDAPVTEIEGPMEAQAWPDE